MKTKAKMPASHSQPVWCHHCCIRIAPYSLKTVFRGKDYHKDCYLKISRPDRKMGS
jgi:hypothetical protein